MSEKPADTTNETKPNSKRSSDIVSLESGLGSDRTNNEKPFVKSPQEQTLVRKINWAFIPFVCLILFVQYTDKSTLNLSAVMGIFEDTRITKTQFSWLGSLFYVGYLAFQIPNQYLVQRLPISKYLGVLLVLWGVSLGFTALGKNFAQLAALRFLLGFFEASTYPTVILLISTLYRRSEQILWYSTMYSTNAVSTAISGLIAYGIGYMGGLRGLGAWQWSMIIWGCVTVASGILVFLFMPDRAKSRWFRLSPEQEKIVDDRTRDNTVVRTNKFEKAHIIEALKEPRYYASVIMTLCLNLQNGSLTVFSSLIIKDIGFTNLQSILLNIPLGVASCICLYMAAYLSRRFNAVNAVGALMMSISLVSALILVSVPSGGVRLLGLYIGATSPPWICLQTSVSNNVSGYTKKIFYNGSLMIGHCLGNFIGPLMMVDKQAPRYIGGMCGYIGADFLTVILFLYLRWSYQRENARRKRLWAEGAIPPAFSNREELDLTDCEDLNFVYRP